MRFKKHANTSLAPSRQFCHLTTWYRCNRARHREHKQSELWSFKDLFIGSVFMALNNTRQRIDLREILRYSVIISTIQALLLRSPFDRTNYLMVNWG